MVSGTALRLFDGAPAVAAQLGAKSAAADQVVEAANAMAKADAKANAKANAKARAKAKGAVQADLCAVCQLLFECGFDDYKQSKFLRAVAEVVKAVHAAWPTAPDLQDGLGLSWLKPAKLRPPHLLVRASPAQPRCSDSHSTPDQRTAHAVFDQTWLGCLCALTLTRAFSAVANALGLETPPVVLDPAHHPRRLAADAEVGRLENSRKEAARKDMAYRQNPAFHHS